MTNNTQKNLIVILGATATGKTDIAIQLARNLKSEIISSDSRQIYTEMSIGTAKPTAEELAAVPHHMISVRSVADHYSSGHYEQDALGVITELFKTHDTLFLTGGSGLYIDAVCKGMDDLPDVDPTLREKLTRRLEQEGISSLLDELKRLDPVYYETVDSSNPQRIMRALEVTLQTGKPYSQLRIGKQKERPFNIIKIGITMPREILYDRINRRVDVMMTQGLENEARGLHPLRNTNALQTVGYKELFDYFEGRISLPEAIELIKRNSRRYAKRQQTWFGRYNDIEWFDMSLTTIKDVENYLGFV